MVEAVLLFGALEVKYPLDFADEDPAGPAQVLQTSSGTSFGAVELLAGAMPILYSQAGAGLIAHRMFRTRDGPVAAFEIDVASISFPLTPTVVRRFPSFALSCAGTIPGAVRAMADEVPIGNRPEFPLAGVLFAQNLPGPYPGCVILARIAGDAAHRPAPRNWVKIR